MRWRQAIYTSKNDLHRLTKRCLRYNKTYLLSCIFFTISQIFHQIYCNDSFSASRHSIDNYFIKSTFFKLLHNVLDCLSLTIIEFFVRRILKQIRVLNFLDGMLYQLLSLKLSPKGCKFLVVFLLLIILLIRNTFIFISHFIKLIRSDILNQLRLIIKCNRLIKKL